MKEHIVQVSLQADQELTSLKIDFPSPLPIEQQYYYLNCIQQLVAKHLQEMEKQTSTSVQSSSQV